MGAFQLSIKQSDEKSVQVGVSGNWTIENAAAIEKYLKKHDVHDLEDSKITFVCDGVERIDTAGAWILNTLIEVLRAANENVEIDKFQDKHFKFLTKIKEIDCEEHCTDDATDSIYQNMVDLGKMAIGAFWHIIEAASFLGRVFITFLKGLTNPRRLRFNAITRHIHESGLNAVPIVGLMAFLIAIVLAYQGAAQLEQFGAGIFTVNLVTVSVLREMGVLLTAILIAGRSGSAYAAEIGVMKLNEEVDALKTTGLDPYELLILPRIIALVIIMPILTFFADICGLIGGGIAALFILDIPLVQYIDRLYDAATIEHFAVGMIKAPVFAFLIATVATFRGMQASGTAESVGRLTTVSVVQSIFLVIVADAAFSIIFSNLGI